MEHHKHEMAASQCLYPFILNFIYMSLGEKKGGGGGKKNNPCTKKREGKRIRSAK